MCTQGARSINAKHHPRWILIGSLILIAVLVVGCGRGATGPFATPTPAPTFTPGPTEIPSRPTEPPPGSAENPLSLYLVAPGSPSVYAEEIATLEEALAEATGLEVKVRVTDSYAEVLAGLCNRSVHMGTLDAFGYLSASERGCATPALVAERSGETSRRAQLIANTASRITNVESFRGRTFCRPDPESDYGWILPGVTLRARGIDPLNELDAVVDVDGDEGVVRAVHDGDCDVGATLLGTEEAVRDLEDPGNVTFVEALTPLPNDVLVFGSVVPAPLRESAMEAFTNAEGALLDVMLADALRTARDADYEDLRALFEAAGVDVVSLGR